MFCVKNEGFLVGNGLMSYDTGRKCFYHKWWISSASITKFIRAYTWCSTCTQNWYSRFLFCRLRFCKSRNLTEKNTSVVHEAASKLCQRTAWQIWIVCTVLSTVLFCNISGVKNLVSYETIYVLRREGFIFMQKKEDSCFEKIFDGIWYWRNVIVQDTRCIISYHVLSL